MKLDRAGETYRVHPYPTSWDFWTDWADGSWEPASFEAIDEHLDPDSTFVDVGAWVGPLTIYAARRCARVVALEPDPMARAVLEENVKRNDLGNVEVLPFALAGTDGWQTFGHRGHDGEAGEWGNSMSGLGEKAGAIEVQTVTPPTLWRMCELEHVGLVKVDIEGGEAGLVAHADFLRQQPLLLALHGPWLTQSEQQLVGDAFDCDARDFGQVLL